MRNLIDIVTNEMLTEAKQDYLLMINPVLDAIKMSASDRKDDPAINFTEKYQEKISSIWENEVKWARNNLRKQDRIVWYLRLCRALLIMQNITAMDAEKANQQLQDYAQKSELAINLDTFMMTSAIKNNITHYLSLPIPVIQNYQFRFQSYEEVIGDFDQAETKWKQQVANTFEDDESEVLIDFKNGWAWVNTNKAYCSKEANAMGHCGNGPRENSHDRLLSLRKKVPMGKDENGKELVRWEPHLTFILDDSGMLTEMKGRANDKPVEKYHPMIVALLLDPIVEGVVGGGYMPENNFSINDLSAGMRDSLLDKKPELGSLYDMFEKFGFTNVVKARLESMLRGMGSGYGGLEIYEYRDDTVVLHHWDDIDSFIREECQNNDFGLESINNLANTDWAEIEWLDFKDESEGIGEMIAQSSTPDEDARIAKFELELDRKTGVSGEKSMEALFHIFPKSIQKIFSYVREFAQKEADLYINRFVTDKFRFNFRSASLKIDEDDSVILVCDADDLIDAVSHYADDEDDNHGFYHAANDGEWLSSDFDFDNDGDYEVVTFEMIYVSVQNKLIEEILNLFETNDQLSFDY